MLKYLANLHIRVCIVFLILIGIPFTGLIAQDDEGKPDRIWNVKIEGNKEYSDIVLKNYISNEAPSLWKKITFFNESGYYVSDPEIRRDAIRIERFYQRRGFNEVEVTHRLDSKNKEWKKELIFVVVEKSPFVLTPFKFLHKPQDKTAQLFTGAKSLEKN